MSDKTKDKVKTKAEDGILTEKDAHPVSGLKIRRYKAEEVKIVNKPRKMALVKPRRLKEDTEDIANSAMLVFPTDRLGIATELKAAGIRAASKLGTDDEALALIEEVMGTLLKHMKARVKRNKTSGPLKRRNSSVVEAPESEETAEEVETPTEDVKTPVRQKSAKKAKGKK